MKPVGWIVDGIFFDSLGAALNMSLNFEQPCIPLYTAPRELSDEEIDEVASDFSELYESEARVYAAIEDAHGFARAILKKASEK